MLRYERAARNDGEVHVSRANANERLDVLTKSHDERENRVSDVTGHVYPPSVLARNRGWAANGHSQFAKARTKILVPSADRHPIYHGDFHPFPVVGIKGEVNREMHLLNPLGDCE